MKWTEYRELSIEDRRNRLAARFKADCHDALVQWNTDFPDRRVSQDRVTHFVWLASGLRSAHSLLKDPVPIPPPGTTQTPRAWARERYVPFPDADFAFAVLEPPETKGECFCAELAALGALAEGWRSPAKTGEKAKGALRRGILQIVSDHWASFGGRDQIVLFLDSTDLRGKTTMDAAREYAAWSGSKESVESLARAINERVARIFPR